MFLISSQNCSDINECNLNYGYCSQITNCLNLNGSAFCFCYNSPIIPNIAASSGVGVSNVKTSAGYSLSEPSISVCKQNFFNTYTLLSDNMGLKLSDNLIDLNSEFVRTFSLPNFFVLTLINFYFQAYLSDYSKLKQSNDGHIEAVDALYEPSNRNYVKIVALYNTINYETRERMSKFVRYSLDTSSLKVAGDSIMQTVGQTKHEIPLRLVDHPKDLAIEWISKRIYWTEYRLGHIMCAYLDGSNETVVITEQPNYHPLSIAINSLIGRLYWSSIGIQVRIRSANIDGTNRVDLVESKLQYPINLRLDLYNYRLYWLDYKLKKIDSISLLAKKQQQQQQIDRQTVYRFDETYQPKQFDLFDDYIYVIGRNYSKEKMNKVIIIHKFNKPIQRVDVFNKQLKEKYKNLKINKNFTLEFIEFSSILSYIYLINPLKQPNEKYIYMSKCDFFF